MDLQPITHKQQWTATSTAIDDRRYCITTALKTALTDLKMKHRATTKSRHQPARSCKIKNVLPVNYTPPLFRMPIELRTMIYELVAHSTLNEARALGFKTPPTTFAILRVSQQIRFEARPSWSQALDVVVDHSCDETQQKRDICVIVRKQLVTRLRNDPNLRRDRITFRLYYLHKAFGMAMDEMERWKDAVQMLCIEMYKMRTEWP
ncbi:hypothetical protein LTR95_012906 [Oleoguttula sp. CCFEE 5521]